MPLETTNGVTLYEVWRDQSREDLQAERSRLRDILQRMNEQTPQHVLRSFLEEAKRLRNVTLTEAALAQAEAAQAQEQVAQVQAEAAQAREEAAQAPGWRNRMKALRDPELQFSLLEHLGKFGDDRTCDEIVRINALREWLPFEDFRDRLNKLGSRYC